MDHIKLLSDTLLHGHSDQPSKPKRAVDSVPVVFGVILLLALVIPQAPRILPGHNDFAALYAGGKLVGTPGIYSHSANDALILATTGVTMDSVVYTRPPFYAALLKPLASLPYLVAYGLFVALCLASILWFVKRFAKDCPTLPLIASVCVPIAVVFPQGQDTPFLLVIIGAYILLDRQKRDFLAGLVLSLCAIKFHLFLLLPLLLLLKKRFRTLAGAGCGTLLLFLLGVLVAGAGSSAQYIKTLRDPYINFSVHSTPNIHGFVASLYPSSAIEMILTGAVVLGFIWACQKTENYESLFGLSLLCGLLVSYHAGTGDLILVLPAFVLMIPSAHKHLRMALAMAASPLPFLLPLSLGPPPAFLLTVALAVAGMRDASASRLGASPLPELPVHRV